MKQTVKRVELDGREFILVGTAHISGESVHEVAQVLQDEKPDHVCIELDDGRLQALKNEKGWQELDISKVLREGRGFLLLLVKAQRMHLIGKLQLFQGNRNLVAIGCGGGIQINHGELLKQSAQGPQLLHASQGAWKKGLKQSATDWAPASSSRCK